MSADPKTIEFPTLTELKHSIPNECFESDASKSLYYVARSFGISAALALTLYYTRQLVANFFALDVALCLAYIYVQGVVFWGLFTIGHDCGHSSFSRYHSLNFVIGCLTHSFILTPFEPWRITHRHHHKNTGNIDKDEIFYPHREETADQRKRVIVYGGGFAWFFYLAVSHFNVYEPRFFRRASAVVASIASWCLAAATAGYLTHIYGFATMGVYYWGPLVVFASFLVVTTFLHHNDEATPWYGDSEWTYVKGNLSSVDRSYGWLVDELSHNIGTHQVHHLFPIIPHYKLNEATRHFRKAYPQFVRKSDEAIIPTFFKVLNLYVRHGVVPMGTQLFTLLDAKKVD